MTIDLIPKALYPLVPTAPGIPAMLRSGARLLDSITLGYLGIGDALNDIIGAEPTKWGVFNAKGEKIAGYDSFNATRYRNSSEISKYPIEQGGFAAYNKVETPFDVMVTLVCGGTEADRSSFLANLEAARKSLQLYTVLMPEFTFRLVNFTGIDYIRTSRDGANMIIANLTGEEVRQKAAAAFSETKAPEGADTSNLGQVQTVDDPNFDVTDIA